MIKETEITIFPNKLNDMSLYKNLAAKNLGLNEKEINAVRVVRRSAQLSVAPKLSGNNAKVY